MVSAGVNFRCSHAEMLDKQTYGVKVQARGPAGSAGLGGQRSGQVEYKSQEGCSLREACVALGEQREEGQQSLRENTWERGGEKPRKQGFNKEALEADACCEPAQEAERASGT